MSNESASNAIQLIKDNNIKELIECYKNDKKSDKKS
jgi:uncharacterized protein YegP (UPF0339 family)